MDGKPGRIKRWRLRVAIRHLRAPASSATSELLSHRIGIDTRQRPGATIRPFVLQTMWVSHDQAGAQIGQPGLEHLPLRWPGICPE